MNVLDLPYKGAKDFFLEQKSYTNLDLPRYFDFSSVLSDLNVYLNGRVFELEEIIKAKSFDDV